MLQQPKPKDYVIGTGVSHSVSDFLVEAMAAMGELSGRDEAPHTIEEWVEVSPQFLRTGEIHDLRADARQARQELGWQPSVNFKQLVRMMVEADWAAVRG